MNKKDYSELHRLLAILRYELEISKLESNNPKHIKELEGYINSIYNLMKVFIVECD